MAKIVHVVRNGRYISSSSKNYGPGDIVTDPKLIRKHRGVLREAWDEEPEPDEEEDDLEPSDLYDPDNPDAAF